jgi:ubiquinone/menaquinone biosynthesis C-methylase UbiE
LSNQPASRIEAEFDRIAQFDREHDHWNHNNHYHAYLLRHAPAACADALEIGCGTGTFARLLAQRSQRVLGIDLSSEMLRIARERSAAYPQITYQQADFLTLDMPDESFDCIASIATLHHMSLYTALAKIKHLLRPGGVLLVLDLFESKGLSDLLPNMAAVVMHNIYDQVKNGSKSHSAEESAAWDAHGSGDVYCQMQQVREICAAVLPGAQVTRHLLWRYSIIWTK